MKTWEDFLSEAKEINDSINQEIEYLEILANIVNTIIGKRKKIGISQRELAEKCGLPHSSIARIESCNVKPNIETLIKIMKPLNLTISIIDR